MTTPTTSSLLRQPNWNEKGFFLFLHFKWEQTTSFMNSPNKLCSQGLHACGTAGCPPGMVSFGRIHDRSLFDVTIAQEWNENTKETFLKGCLLLRKIQVSVLFTAQSLLSPFYQINLETNFDTTAEGLWIVEHIKLQGVLCYQRQYQTHQEIFH